MPVNEKPYRTEEISLTPEQQYEADVKTISDFLTPKLEALANRAKLKDSPEARRGDMTMIDYTMTTEELAVGKILGIDIDKKDIANRTNAARMAQINNKWRVVFRTALEGEDQERVAAVAIASEIVDVYLTNANKNLQAAQEKYAAVDNPDTRKALNAKSIELRGLIQELDDYQTGKIKLQQWEAQTKMLRRYSLNQDITESPLVKAGTNLEHATQEHTRLTEVKEALKRQLPEAS